jgi:hypothetical protein
MRWDMREITPSEFSEEKTYCVGQGEFLPPFPQNRTGRLGQNYVWTPSAFFLFEKRGILCGSASQHPIYIHKVHRIAIRGKDTAVESRHNETKNPEEYWREYTRVMPRITPR